MVMASQESSGAATGEKMEHNGKQGEHKQDMNQDARDVEQHETADPRQKQ
jgi:hypothetical protein